MNGITELAKLLKARENKTEYSPMFGRIIELPDLKIRLSDKVILTAEHIKTCVSLDTLSSDGEYIYLGSEVVMLPYCDNQKFIVIGVVQ